MNEEIHFKNCYELFKLAMKDNYNSMDLLIRTLAIDNYFNKNSYGFNLYNKVQHARVNQIKAIPRKQYNNVKRFKKLIKSIQKKGFDINFPLFVNKNGIVIDGAHRLAICLYFGIKEVPVVYKKEFADIDYDYSLEWLKNNGFGQYEELMLKTLKLIQKKYEEE